MNDDDADYIDIFVPVTFPEINFVKVEVVLKDNGKEKEDDEAGC